MGAEVYSAIGDMLSGVAGCVAVGIAIWQLGGIKKSFELASKDQKLNSLQIVLEIESQMNNRKVEFDKTAKEIRENKDNPDKLEILKDYFNSAKENYFNSLDRLCFCILKKYLLDREWKADYRNLLLKTIETYESDFGEASPYKNLKELNRQWQSE